MKIVVFDLWGDYAHFRVPYTTSSPLTFPVPTKTVLYGTIGAFLGYDKSSYLKNFQNQKWKFAISIKAPIIKTYISENFINTKAVKLFARMPIEKSCRTQINIEFIKSPKYRIFITSSEKDELNRLEQLLKEHKSVYTVTLGLSECIANFEFIGSFTGVFENNNEGFTKISSIIPLEYFKDNSKIDFLIEGQKFLKIRMPTEMKPDRELMEAKDFIIETTGKAIRAKFDNHIYIKELNENILLF